MQETDLLLEDLVFEKQDEVEEVLLLVLMCGEKRDGEVQLGVATAGEDDGRTCIALRVVSRDSVVDEK